MDDLFEFFERERRRRFRSTVITTVIGFIVLIGSIMGLIYLWKEVMQ
jgi:hypothetical protein